MYKNIIPKSSPFNYNSPSKENDRAEFNFDLTNKENFDIRKVEGLGFGYKRIK